MQTDSWQLYEDPDGYYSLRIPDDWSVQRSTSLERAYRHDQFLFEIPRSSLLCGPAPDANNHFLVRVSLTVLRDRAALAQAAVAPTTPDAHGRHGKAHTLPQAPAPNATLGGAPAYHAGVRWEIDLPEAHVTLDYIRVRRPYRAFGEDDTLTPQQQDAWARFAPLADAVIASFTPGQPSGWQG